MGTTLQLECEGISSEGKVDALRHAEELDCNPGEVPMILLGHELDFMLLQGVCKTAEGLVVFVPRAIPGETLTAVVTNAGGGKRWEEPVSMLACKPAPFKSHTVHPKNQCRL